nr:hypothetical protein [Chthoniobacter flavus]
MQHAHDDRAQYRPQRHLAQHGQREPPAGAMRGRSQRETDGEGADVLREDDEDLHQFAQSGKGEGHERDAVVARVVKHRGQLQRAGVPGFVAHAASDNRTEHEHAGDDARGEAHDAGGCGAAEIRVDDVNEDKRRDEEVDVQLDQRFQVEPAAPINQPAKTEHHEDGQQDVGEDGPEKHVGKRGSRRPWKRTGAKASLGIVPKNKKREP